MALVIGIGLVVLGIVGGACGAATVIFHSHANGVEGHSCWKCQQRGIRPRHDGRPA